MEKLLHNIEMANNAYLISNAGGVVVFAASQFAADGIARKSGQAVKLVEKGGREAWGEPKPNTYAVVVR
jgi:hypothetical protein